MAQPGSALRSGRRGPQFKSGHPDRVAGEPSVPPREIRRSRRRRRPAARRSAGGRSRRSPAAARASRRAYSNASSTGSWLSRAPQSTSAGQRTRSRSAADVVAHERPRGADRVGVPRRARRGRPPTSSAASAGGSAAPQRPKTTVLAAAQSAPPGPRCGAIRRPGLSDPGDRQRVARPCASRTRSPPRRRARARSTRLGPADRQPQPRPRRRASGRRTAAGSARSCSQHAARAGRRRRSGVGAAGSGAEPPCPGSSGTSTPPSRQQQRARARASSPPRRRARARARAASPGAGDEVAEPAAARVDEALLESRQLDALRPSPQGDYSSGRWIASGRRAPDSCRTPTRSGRLARLAL